MEIRENSIKKKFGKQEAKKSNVNLESTLSYVDKDKLESKTYVVLGNNMLGNQYIKNRSMSNILDKNNFPREIRYLQGANSIFVDEQGPSVAGLRSLPILLERGKLVTQSSLLQKYMDATVYNQANPMDGFNAVFKLEDSVRDAERELERRKITNDAVNAATVGLSLDALKPIARSLGLSNIYNLQPSEIRVWAINYAEKNPEAFMEKIDSPLPPIIDMVSQALEQKIIEFTHNRSRVAWVGAGAFLTIPPGYEDQRIDFVAQNLLNKEFSDVVEQLQKSLGTKLPNATTK